MEFIIENCSSPGAQFSRSTNQVMLKIAEWINQNNEPDLMFIDFRRRLEKEAKINDNNARNIYPLLKNGGLVEYQSGSISGKSAGSFFHWIIRTVVFVAIWAVTYGVIWIGKFVMAHKIQVAIGICSIVAAVIAVKIFVWFKEQNELVKVSIKVEDKDNR